MPCPIRSKADIETISCNDTTKNWSRKKPFFLYSMLSIDEKSECKTLILKSLSYSE